MYQLGNVPRNYKKYTPEEKDAEVGGDELTPYLVHSKSLDSRFVLGAAAGSQHTVVLAISVDEDLNAQADSQSGMSVKDKVQAINNQNMGLKRGIRDMTEDAEDMGDERDSRGRTYSKPDVSKNENLTGSGTKKLNNVFETSARKSKEEANRPNFGGKPPVFPGLGGAGAGAGADTGASGITGNNIFGSVPKLSSPAKFSEYRPGGDLASVSKISVGNRGSNSPRAKRVKRNPMAFAEEELKAAVDFAKDKLDVKMSDIQDDDDDIANL